MNFKNKPILITGADGFIGSHLIDALISRGAIVSGYVRGSSHMQLRNLDRERPIPLITGDIGSTDAVRLIRKNNPEVIFHLAADAYVPNSFDHPIEVMESNLKGTLNVLHAAMDSDVKRIVVTSSSEIYGSHDEAINEETSMYPSSPYAASKVAADRYAYAYYNTYGLPVSIIRPFNVFGSRHTYDCPQLFINQAIQNLPLTINGNGKQSRDLTYISDMIEAFLIMGSHKSAVGEAINFGSGKDVSILDLAKLIIKLSKSKSQIIHGPPRTSEVQRLLCNYSKANRLFGWRPKISLAEGLKKNIEYERRNLK